MEYTYDKGYYVLNGGPQTLKPADRRFKEVAILYSDAPNAGTVLLKHGNAEWVQHEYDRVQSKYREAGFHDMADELKLIRGTKIPVSELNKCISISGYVGHMVEHQAHRAREAEEPSLAM